MNKPDRLRIEFTGFIGLGVRYSNKDDLPFECELYLMIPFITITGGIGWRKS